MQFYRDGFRSGDPEVQPAAPGAERAEPADQVDVVVVGAGPAGLLLGAQLAAFPEITYRVLERRPERMALGQADGVACRTVEMFQAFGLGERLVREAYWITETAFWATDDSDPDGAVTLKSRVQDVEDGLSEMPHVIVNQARLQDLLVDAMQRAPQRVRPEYGMELQSVTVGDEGDYPVLVTARRAAADGGEELVEIRAKYVVGADGARSTVRGAIGLELKGEPQNQVWGVLDLLAETDFPDIRRKCIIRSDRGNIGIIPREGGYLVRFYVDLGEAPAGATDLREKITPEKIIEAAQKVFKPYKLDVREVPWWSVYQVGQRLTDRFDDVVDAERGRRSPRVFIAGDACHTHSAKAGQGMNVSMQDSFNLGWKLAAVLRGRSPESLLDTYTGERQPVAHELIEFDKMFSKVMGGRPQQAAAAEEDSESADIRRAFTAAGRYTAGVATHYPAALLIGDSTHQQLAEGFTVGKRFHSAPVIRVADAKPMQLGHVHQADGRWRIYLFADGASATQPDSALNQLCEFLASSEDSPITRFTPSGGYVDDVFDVRAVFPHHHHELGVEDVHPLLLPRTGKLGLKDYEKVYTADLSEGRDIFDLRGIDRTRGAMVVVRPDQYVAQVLPLQDRTQLTEFFAGFMNDGRVREESPVLVGGANA